MNTYKILFSPTGGTKRVVDILTGRLAENALTIDLCDRTMDFSGIDFTPEDLCVIAVPSYGGRVPGIAVQRLSQLKGDGAKAVLIAVYGNREFEDTLVELKDTLDAAGFVCVAAIAAVAEHSILPQFASGRPDAEDVQELEGYADTIRDRLSKDSLPELIVAGNRPYKPFKVLPMTPAANKSCIGCGICAKGCPVGAIPMDEPQTTDNDKCISCMRCIRVCPQNARRVNKLLLVGAQQKLKKACSIRKGNTLF